MEYTVLAFTNIINVSILYKKRHKFMDKYSRKAFSKH